MKLTDKEKEQRVKEGIQCGFFRRAMGLTIKECADRLGVSEQTINNIESGKQSPFKLEFIKKAYGYKNIDTNVIINNIEWVLVGVKSLTREKEALISSIRENKELLKDCEKDLELFVKGLPHNRGVKLSERTLQWLKENKAYLESL